MPLTLNKFSRIEKLDDPCGKSRSNRQTPFCRGAAILVLVNSPRVTEREWLERLPRIGVRVRRYIGRLESTKDQLPRPHFPLFIVPWLIFLLLRRSRDVDNDSSRPRRCTQLLWGRGGRTRREGERTATAALQVSERASERACAERPNHQGGRGGWWKVETWGLTAF